MEIHLHPFNSCRFKTPHGFITIVGRPTRILSRYRPNEVATCSLTCISMFYICVSPDARIWLIINRTWLKCQFNVFTGKGTWAPLMLARSLRLPEMPSKEPWSAVQWSLLQPRVSNKAGWVGSGQFVTSQTVVHVQQHCTDPLHVEGCSRLLLLFCTQLLYYVYTK